MKSSAPCLWGTKPWHNSSKRCWEEVMAGSGYCPAHQPEPYHTGREGGFKAWAPPKGWGRLREQVMNRDKGVCYVCKKPGADEVDHIVAIALGGTNLPSNLAPIHQRVAPHCHRKKTQGDARAAVRMNRPKRRGR